MQLVYQQVIFNIIYISPRQEDSDIKVIKYKLDIAVLFCTHTRYKLLCIHRWTVDEA